MCWPWRGPWTRRVRSPRASARTVCDQTRALRIQDLHQPGVDARRRQTVRQTYALEVGNLAEPITVSETSPLVQTTSTAQTQTIGNEVREIPVSRRNLQNVVLLAPESVRLITPSGAAGRFASTASATAAARSL